MQNTPKIGLVSMAVRKLSKSKFDFGRQFARHGVPLEVHVPCRPVKPIAKFRQGYLACQIPNQLIVNL
jgi:hypothetical protein